MGPVPSIVHIIKGIGEEAAIEALRCDDSDEALKFIQKYDSIPPSDLGHFRLEEIAAICGINTRTLIQTLTGALYTQSQEAAKVLVLVNQPKVTQKTIDMALTDRGEKDREFFLRGTGFLPVPKGAQITINQQNNTMAAAPQLQSESRVPLVLGSTDDLLLDMQTVLRPDRALTSGEETNTAVPVNAPEIEYMDV